MIKEIPATNSRLPMLQLIMHYDLIIKNGTIVTPAESFSGCLAVSKGKIVKTGILDPSDTADEIYDADGKHVLPGIIDAHVHFRDPGLTEKEDFETGSIAAAMGGITLVADMPNVIPVTSTYERFKEKKYIAKDKSYVDFALFALLNNENLEDMEDLKKAGALGFKIFYGSSTGDIAAPSHVVLTQQMEKAASLGMRVGFHCETNDCNSQFTEIAKKETETPDGFWLDYARPVLSEANAISQVIHYAKHLGTKVHIHHVSSLDGALLSAEAKQNGINLTTEVCPHYLIFDCENYTFKVYPPVRDESHRDGLWEAVKKGVIDIIASDHAPHTKEDKAKKGWDAPAGLSGVETSVNLLLNEVNKDSLSINEYVRLASESPAKVWGIYPQKGNLLPGADADITIVDMNMKKIIKADELHSKSKTSPYDQMEVKGIPIATIIRGKFVMRDGKLTGKKGYGEFVSPLNPV